MNRGRTGVTVDWPCDPITKREIDSSNAEYSHRSVFVNGRVAELPSGRYENGPEVGV